MSQALTIFKANKKAAALKIYREHKLTVLNSDEVKSGMTENELTLIGKSTGETIREINVQRRGKDLVELARGIAREAGIQSWRNDEIMKYDAASFSKIVSDNFQDLTLSEVKYAFEAADMGKLDAHLPRDKYGQPEKNHYQVFSREFIVRILKAYRAYKGSVWIKAEGLLPQNTYTATEEEKKIYHDAFTKKIHELFHAYKNDKVTPNFLRPQMVIDRFVDAQVLKERPEPNQEEIGQSFLSVMLDSDVNKYKKNAAKNKRAEGEVDNLVAARANRKVYNKKIVHVFDRMIKAGKKIEDIIK